MISSISSLNNEYIKEVYKRTRDNKDHLCVIESVNVIKEMVLSNKQMDCLFLTQDFLDANKWVRNQQKIIVTNQNIINKLSYTEHPPKCIAIYDFKLDNFNIIEDDYVILDHIKDPGNLATIIRTAVAFNINKIFVSKNSVNLHNDKIIRSSMGTIFKIKVNYYDNLSDLVSLLEVNNVEVIASILDEQATNLNDYEPKNKHHAIIVGNESRGIDKQDIAVLKNKVYIKINNTDSLNVAVASSILLYQKQLWDKKWKK